MLASLYSTIIEYRECRLASTDSTSSFNKKALILFLDSQICVLTATFVWLEEGIQMKEEWRSAATEYVGLSGVQDGTVLMLLLPVGNLDFISPNQVSSVHISIIGNLQNCNSRTIGVNILFYNSGSGPILFTYLNCDGTESRLSDCSTYSSYNFGARHSSNSDAGVRCQQPTVTSMHNTGIFTALYD